MAYIFTDWRMWIYLFDLVEGSGLGVRNMIVWKSKAPAWERLEGNMSSSCLHTAQSRSGIITKATATYWRPHAPGMNCTRRRNPSKYWRSCWTIPSGRGRPRHLRRIRHDVDRGRERRAAGVPHGNGARICGHDREAYIRTTGNTTEIRLIRKGAEQPREVFEGIFE